MVCVGGGSFELKYNTWGCSASSLLLGPPNDIDMGETAFLGVNWARFLNNWRDFKQYVFVYSPYQCYTGPG